MKMMMEREKERERKHKTGLKRCTGLLNVSPNAHVLKVLFQWHHYGEEMEHQDKVVLIQQLY